MRWHFVGSSLLQSSLTSEPRLLCFWLLYSILLQRLLVQPAPYSVFAAASPQHVDALYARLTCSYPLSQFPPCLDLASRVTTRTFSIFTRSVLQFCAGQEDSEGVGL
jgi:hypothetical protein